MPDIASGAAGVSIVGGLTGIGSSKKAASAANTHAEAAAFAAAKQAELADNQDARVEESWNRFKELYWPQEEAALQRYNEVYLPLEDEEIARYRDVYRPLEDEEIARRRDIYRPLEDDYIAMSREGIQPRYEEVATDAADTTAGAFDRAQDMNRRAMSRYNVMPSMAMDREMSADRAAAIAHSKNTARRDERTRVEDTNYMRMQNAVAMTRGAPITGHAPNTPGAPTGSAAVPNSGAASTYGQSAGIYTQLANMMQRDAANAGYAGVGMIRTGLDYLQQNNPFATSPAPGGTGHPGYDPYGGTWGQSNLDGTNLT